MNQARRNNDKKFRPISKATAYSTMTGLFGQPLALRIRQDINHFARENSCLDVPPKGDLVEVGMMLVKHTAPGFAKPEPCFELGRKTIVLADVEPGFGAQPFDLVSGLG